MSTSELSRAAACVRASPKLWGSGKSRLFQPVPGEVSRVALAAVSGCWIWPPWSVLLLKQWWERAWLPPNISFMPVCLKHGSRFESKRQLLPF